MSQHQQGAGNFTDLKPRSLYDPCKSRTCIKSHINSAYLQENHPTRVTTQHTFHNTVIRN
jgi:hypothetical protein